MDFCRFSMQPVFNTGSSTRLQFVDHHGPVQGNQHGIQESQLNEDGDAEKGRQLPRSNVAVGKLVDERMVMWYMIIYIYIRIYMIYL